MRILLFVLSSLISFSPELFPGSTAAFAADDLFDESCPGKILAPPTALDVKTRGTRSSDVDTLELWGVIDGGPAPRKLGKITYAVMEREGADDHFLHVTEVDVEPGLRGRGIQKYLYRFAHARAAVRFKVVRVLVDGLIDTNEFVFYSSFIELLKANHSEHLSFPSDLKAFPVAGVLQSIQEMNDEAIYWRELFDKNFRGYVLSHQSETHAELLAAIRKTPIYKGHAGEGFTRFCDEENLKLPFYSEPVFELCNE